MKIKITKFKTIENFEAEIPFSISGGNGVGKSTILEAISFSLTGKNLDGNEFKQVYDNRVDLHDAIADVSFFDDYGNEFQRIVKPIFQTNRAGIEEIKIKRSTECRKNGIPCNDFAPEFSDFYKFGTDFFFRQKEDVQRSIFIDLLKSRLPDYDVKSESLRLKELKKSQKTEVSEIDKAKEVIKSVKDVEVPEVSAELQAQNDEFLRLSNASKLEEIAAINKENNEALQSFYDQKNALLREKSSTENSILCIENEISAKTKELETLKNSKFEAKEARPTEQLEEQVEQLTDDLNSLTYYHSLKEYADVNFDKNPILVENRGKIDTILSAKFNPSIYEITDKCPLNGSVCETAKSHSLEASRVKFSEDLNRKLETVKSENREILTKEMNEANDLYLSAQRKLINAENQLAEAREYNSKIESENEANRKAFFELNAKTHTAVSGLIKQLQSDLKDASNTLTGLNYELSNLSEATLKKLPESVEISNDLKEANAQFIAKTNGIIGAIAINENNAKLRAEKTEEIKKRQSILFKISEEIAILQSQISDYFANLKGVVSEEFKGGISIDVELLEYVMANDDYKDCFKITANGKVFPYECNGALQNNTKLQILANMQRLANYNGVTVIDNCEANTTDPLNTLNLKCVTAFATNENQLTIK